MAGSNPAAAAAAPGVPARANPAGVGDAGASTQGDTVPSHEPDGGAGDDEAPEWPDESVEAAMLAEQRERDDSEPPQSRAPRTRPADEADAEAALPLPALDALIEKIPPNVRETLDELFRARFTSVQRVPKQAIKD